MTRKDFLKNIGIGAAFVLTVPCLHSCGDDDDGGPTELSAGPQNFTLDLDAPENAALANVGGFVISNKVVVARAVDGQFAAASLVCSHEGTEVMVYNEVDDQWFCSTHGAEFATRTGVPQNNVTDRNLRIYAVTQTGNTLTVNG